MIEGLHYSDSDLDANRKLSDDFPQFQASSSKSGSNPVCCNVSGSFWYHPDYLGSVDIVTNPSGEVEQFFLYNPWGEQMYRYDNPSATFDSPYRFNGKELDEETGLAYYGARYYDNQLSMWLSVDPLYSRYPNLTPYNYVDNNPVHYVDPDGRYKLPAAFVARYKNISNYLNSNALLEYVQKNPRIKEGYIKFGERFSDGTTYFTDERISEIFTAGEGPTLSAIKFNEEDLSPNAQTWRENDIEFNEDYLDGLEAILADPNASEEDKQGAMLKFIVTATHEPIHSSEWGTGGKSTFDEMGNIFEPYVFGQADLDNVDDNFNFEGYNKYMGWKAGEISNQEYFDYLRANGHESIIPEFE